MKENKMRNLSLLLFFVSTAFCFNVSFAHRYVRSVKSPQRFRGGSYPTGTPISPSRARFSSPSGGSAYGGTSDGGSFASAAALGSSYGNGGANGFGGSAGSSGGGSYGTNGFGGGQYAEEHPAPEPYNFQYAANDEYGNNQYRNEEQDQSGTIRGSYGYTDANGLYRVVDYVADNDGFRASIRSNEPGGLTEPNPSTGSVDNPADVQLSPEPVPAGIRQQQEQYQRYNGASAHSGAGSAASAGRYRAPSAAGASYGAASAGSYGGGSASGARGGGASGYGGGYSGVGGFGDGGHGAGKQIIQQKLRGFSEKY